MLQGQHIVFEPRRSHRNTLGALIGTIHSGRIPGISFRNMKNQTQLHSLHRQHPIPFAGDVLRQSAESHKNYSKE